MTTAAKALTTAAASGSIHKHLPPPLQRGLPSLPSATLNPYAPAARWILGTSALVAGMVHVGGVTRLTRSGLSMTDWKPLGSLPPLTDEEWAREFERYKSFPEYQQRRSMSLEEFQFIYKWEYGHRMLGRFVGLCYALPLGYFAFRKRLPPGFGARFATLFVLGGTQGLVGWWMVQSGLGDHRRNDTHEIRVSPYRLAAHLSMAFTTFGLLLWTGLDLLQLPHDWTFSSSQASAGGGGGGGGVYSKTSQNSRLMEVASALHSKARTYARRVRGGAMGMVALTSLTMVSGAFVAGNDAGNAYNTFPYMVEADHDDDDDDDDKVKSTRGKNQFVPYNDMIDPKLRPAYRNLFENTATVQFNHRVLGMSTALSALTLSGIGLFHPLAKNAMTIQVKRGLQFLSLSALGQMTLGIATLVNYVPLSLAAAHQLGSLIVLSCGIYVVHSLRYVSPRVTGSVMRIASASGKKGIVNGGGNGASAVAIEKISEMAIRAGK